jgi:hypothetical protein
VDLGGMNTKIPITPLVNFKCCPHWLTFMLMKKKEPCFGNVLRPILTSLCLVAAWTTLLLTACNTTQSTPLSRPMVQ